MARLFLKVYPKSKSGRLVDGNEIYTKDCYVDDEFLQVIYSIIGETKIVIHDDESTAEESQFPCITDQAIKQLQDKAEDHINKLIITTAEMIHKGKKVSEHYPKLMHLTELMQIIEWSSDFESETEVSVLQLEP